MIANRKPKDFSTLKYPHEQQMVNAIARAKISGDPNVTITLPRSDLPFYLGGYRNIPDIKKHVERATLMMELDGVLLDILSEQGVVDIIKEMALKLDVEVDGICNHCFHAKSIFGIQHLECLDKLHVPEIPERCKKCTKKDDSPSHLVCKMAGVLIRGSSAVRGMWWL